MSNKPERIQLCDNCGGAIEGDADPANPGIHDHPDTCIVVLRNFLDLSRRHSEILEEEARSIRELLGIAEDASETDVLVKIENLQRPPAIPKDHIVRIDSMELAMWRAHKLLKPMRKSEIGKKADDLICAALQVEP